MLLPSWTAAYGIVGQAPSLAFPLAGGALL
jgi:hypothetical protein